VGILHEMSAKLSVAKLPALEWRHVQKTDAAQRCVRAYPVVVPVHGPVATLAPVRLAVVEGILFRFDPCTRASCVMNTPAKQCNYMVRVCVIVVLQTLAFMDAKKQTPQTVNMA
jgi:hypothetical protein